MPGTQCHAAESVHHTTQNIHHMVHKLILNLCLQIVENGYFCQLG